MEDIALSVGVFTRPAIEKITREAFEVCNSRERKRLTVVHKKNVLPESSGLYWKIACEMKASYPQVELEEIHIDAMAAEMLRNPHHFDVIVTENMFGDILSDLASALTGSLGVGGSINFSHSKVMAQAIHGSAPKIANMNIANPTSILFSSLFPCCFRFLHFFILYF